MIKRFSPPTYTFVIVIARRVTNDHGNLPNCERLIPHQKAEWVFKVMRGHLHARSTSFASLLLMTYPQCHEEEEKPEESKRRRVNEIESVSEYSRLIRSTIHVSRTSAGASSSGSNNKCFPVLLRSCPCKPFYNRKGQRYHYRLRSVRIYIVTHFVHYDVGSAHYTLFILEYRSRWWVYPHYVNVWTEKMISRELIFTHQFFDCFFPLSPRKWKMKSKKTLYN